MVRPLTVPTHWIDGVESASLEKTGRQTERHRSIIGPLTGQEPEWPAPNHIRQRLEGASRAEFQCCPYSITDR
jgi:hypothetical protein